MNKWHHIYFVLIFFFAACGSDNTRINIKGNTKGPEGIIRLSTGDSVLLTENIKKDGSFKIDGTISEPGFYYLELFQKGNSEKNQFLIYIDKNPVEINFDVSNLEKYPAISSHSTRQNEISNYYSKLNPLLILADADYKEAKLKMNRGIENGIGGDTLINIIEKFRVAEKRKISVINDIRENYIVNNPSSLLSAYLITQSDTAIWNNPVFYNDLYKTLSPQIRNSKYGLQAKLLIENALKEFENTSSDDSNHHNIIDTSGTL